MSEEIKNSNATTREPYTPEQLNKIKRYAKAAINIPVDAIVKTSKGRMVTKYSKDEVKKYLTDPCGNQNKIFEITDYLYRISPQYRRLVDYIPNAAIVVPFVKQKLSQYNIKSTKKNKDSKALKDYSNMCEYYDTLNIKSTIGLINKDLFRYGVYYGLEIEGEFKSYSKRLDPNYCKIISTNESGYGIAFDFTYFNSMEYILDTGYPKIFKALYKQYKDNKTTLSGLKLKSNWQPLPTEITQVFKLDQTQLDYSLPPYMNIISAIYDLEEYESLNKAKVTAENFTLLNFKIPFIKDTNGEIDAFAISEAMVDACGENLEEVLPEYMGYAFTPMDVDAVYAKSGGQSNVDNVANATKNLWNSAGFSEALFGVENTNSGTLDYSIQVDTQQLFALYRQYENYYDYKIKKKCGKEFKFKLLDVTWFNLKDMIQWYTNMATASIPVAMLLPLLLGFEISDIDDLSIMQEVIFNIFEKWKPLMSSYTTSGKESGRPEKDSKDLTESGDKTRENESNKKK